MPQALVGLQGKIKQDVAAFRKQPSGKLYAITLRFKLFFRKICLGEGNPHAVIAGKSA